MITRLEGKVTLSRSLQLDTVNNDPAWEDRYTHTHTHTHGGNHAKDKGGLRACTLVLRKTDEPECFGAESTSFVLVDLT